MKSFKVKKIGEEFELTLTVVNDNKVTFKEKLFAGIAIFIAMGVCSAAAYGTVTGDYYVFTKILDTFYKMVKAIVEG